MTGPTQLYDLKADIGETTNLASDHPEIVKQLETLMEEAHTPHPNWQVRVPASKR